MDIIRTAIGEKHGQVGWAAHSPELAIAIKNTDIVGLEIEDAINAVEFTFFCEWDATIEEWLADIYHQAVTSGTVVTPLSTLTVIDNNEDFLKP